MDLVIILVVCAAALTVTSVVSGVVLAVRARRKRQPGFKRKKLVHRNSLEKYPTYIAIRVNGVLTLFSLEELKRMNDNIQDESGSGAANNGKLSEQHFVAIDPHQANKGLRDWRAEVDWERLAGDCSRCH